VEVGINEHGLSGVPEFCHVHLRFSLRNLPLRSHGENLAGWTVRVRFPQEGQV